jgi:hypothetical protein
MRIWASPTMAPSTLFRLAGLALIVALPLSIPGYVIHPRTHELADVIGSTTSLSHAIVAVGWALVLLGLPGLFAFHAQRSGVLGLTGFVLMMLFAAYHVYLLLYEAGPVALLSGDAAAERLFAPGGAVRQGMLREWVTPVTVLAPIVYGIALLRAGVVSRWAGWLVIAFIPAFFVLNGVLAILPSATREDLLDLGFANVGLGISYVLLNLGLAIAGYQLWRAQAHESVSPEHRVEPATYAANQRDSVG